MAAVAAVALVGMRRNASSANRDAEAVDGHGSQRRSLPPVQTIHMLRPSISARVSSGSADVAVHVVEVVLVGRREAARAPRRRAWLHLSRCRDAARAATAAENVDGNNDRAESTTAAPANHSKRSFEHVEKTTVTQASRIPKCTQCTLFARIARSKQL